MKTLLLLLILFSFSKANGIDSLLQEYEQESELSNKTKNESAGNLIVYTRDDLERMQVETLKDILKSLRLFQYTENRIAQPDILNQDPLSYYSKGVRVYLNEHELLSSTAGSGFIYFGDMEMDFIDHVEIYEGFPSLDLGIEPATLVIRLYSKSAEHDEGGRVKATVGSYGTNKENVYYSNKTADLSYFFYANRNDEKKDTYQHDGETLKRDLVTHRFYGSLTSEKHTLEFHAMKADGDSFIGSAIGNVPKESTKDIEYLSLSTHSKFLDDSLVLNLSYINATTNFASKYTTGKGIPYDPAFPAIQFTDYKQTLKESSFTSSLKKKWELDSQTITTGIQYRYKSFDISDLKFDDTDAGVVQAYNKENIYSIFLEDSIALNDSNLIILSIMDQEYVRDGNVQNQNTLQLRLGYIYSNTDWVAKTFISSQEFASEPYMTVSPHYGNSALNKEKYNSIIQEVSYNKADTITKAIFSYGVYEDIPVLNQTFTIQNNKEDIHSYFGALEFTLLFSQKDKLELQANYFYIDSAYNNDEILHSNYVARMLNTISDFDIFNELVIRNGYANLDTGYDYSLGIKYEVNRDFHISLKGVNIFNTGPEWDYVNQMSFTTGEVTDRVTVPTLERSFTFGLEYLF